MPRTPRRGIGRPTEMLVATGGLGLGAAAMYVMDPAGGRRRRGLVRDRFVHLAKTADDAVAVIDFATGQTPDFKVFALDE